LTGEAITSPLTLAGICGIIYTPMDKEYVNRNIEIKRLPVATDRALNTLASLRGMTKQDLIREALIEYTDRHRPDIVKLVREHG
jgi:hypothetical protein